jgi:H+/Cl- antiporter ClcA
VSEPFAVRAHFWRVMAGAVLVGLLSGVACLVFLSAEHVITDLIWGDRGTPTGFFTGSWVAALIVLVAAALAGVLRHRTGLGGHDPNFIEEMIEGQVPLKHGLQFGALGLISLVGGASVGPEAPLGTLGGGIGTEVGRRYERSQEATEDLTFAGISGVFGGLGAFPFTGPVMAWEAYHDRWQQGPARMLPGVVSASVALAVLYPALGTPFLAVYDLGDPDLQVGWILLAALLGVVGAALGLVAAVAMGLSARASRRIRLPLWRSLAAGAGIAAIGLVVPLTMFSGREQLTDLLAAGPEITLGLLLAVLVGKLAAFVLSMRWGFFGGPIFPLVFVGAVAGVILHQLVPAVPLVVAVPALAGAVSVALVPLPLMVMVLTTMLFGLRLELGVIPAVAIVVSFVLIRGTGVLARLQPAG